MLFNRQEEIKRRENAKKEREAKREQIRSQLIPMTFMERMRSEYEDSFKRVGILLAIVVPIIIGGAFALKRSIAESNRNASLTAYYSSSKTSYSSVQNSPFDGSVRQVKFWLKSNAERFQFS